MEVFTGRLIDEDATTAIEDLNAIGERHGVAVQAMDARYVACREQLERAATFARRASDRGTTIADDFAMEILLHAAGRRQIEQALTMGIHDETTSVVIVAVHPTASGPAIDEEAFAADLAAVVTLEDWKPGDRREDDRITSFFEIGQAERAATDADLCDLVCERVALLEVQK